MNLAHVHQVKEVVRKELTWPGKCLGYQAMTQKLRTQHGMKIPRYLIHNVFFDLDPEGPADRSLQAKKRKQKELFTSKGPLWVVSVDGHVKLCGYQDWIFPLRIYCMVSLIP